MVRININNVPVRFNYITEPSTMVLGKLIMCSAGQEWNPKVYYHINRIQLSTSVLNQANHIHTLQNYFIEIRFNIIRSLSQGLPSGVFP
jgi:hypothetical protein